jgi:hypothetical protein
MLRLSYFCGIWRLGCYVLPEASRVAKYKWTESARAAKAHAAINAEVRRAEPRPRAKAASGRAKAGATSRAKAASGGAKAASRAVTGTIPGAIPAARPHHRAKKHLVSILSQSGGIVILPRLYAQGVALCNSDYSEGGRRVTKASLCRRAKRYGAFTLGLV